MSRALLAGLALVGCGGVVEPPAPSRPEPEKVSIEVGVFVDLVHANRRGDPARYSRRPKDGYSNVFALHAAKHGDMTCKDGHGTLVGCMAATAVVNGKEYPVPPSGVIAVPHASTYDVRVKSGAPFHDVPDASCGGYDNLMECGGFTIANAEFGAAVRDERGWFVPVKWRASWTLALGAPGLNVNVGWGDPDPFEARTNALGAVRFLRGEWGCLLTGKDQCAAKRTRLRFDDPSETNDFICGRVYVRATGDMWENYAYVDLRRMDWTAVGPGDIRSPKAWTNCEGVLP